jgi:hypothetical protein
MKTIRKISVNFGLFFLGMNVALNENGSKNLAILLWLLILLLLFIPKIIYLIRYLREFTEKIKYYYESKHRLYADDYVYQMNITDEEKRKKLIEIKEIEINNLINTK